MIYVALEYRTEESPANYSNDTPELDAPMAATSQAVAETSSEMPTNTSGSEGETEFAVAVESILKLSAGLRKSRGYFNNDHPYWRFSNDELRGLASAGDILARQTLAYRHQTSDIPAAIEHYEQAIVAGSTNALLELADYYSNLADGTFVERDFLSTEDIPEEIQQEGLQKATTLYLMGMLRGDSHAFTRFDQFISEYPMSTSELQETCRLAEALYGEIEQRRILEGFGEFDDSQDPVGAVRVDVAALPCVESLEYPIESCTTDAISNGSREFEYLDCSRP